jgi:hypothetical protein
LIKYRRNIIFDVWNGRLYGGDKKGKNQEKFYKRLIAEAERIFADHLENMQST